MTSYDSLSLGAQRVRSSYVGLRPSLRNGRILMHLQAYFDESIDGELFALAGYVSTLEKWEKFSEEWEKILPLAPINKRGNHEFKMSHMMSVPERQKDVKAFYNIIRRYTELGLYALVPIHIVEEVWSWFDPAIVYPIWKNVYFVAWRMLFDETHDNRINNGIVPRFYSKNDRIDFICDDRGESGKVRAEFENMYNNASPEFRSFYGESPRFVDSEDYLPVQAADMLAWYVRDRRAQQCYNIFEEWEENTKFAPFVSITLTEEYYFSILLQIFRQLTPKGQEYDIRFPIRLTDTFNRFCATLPDEGPKS